MWLNGLGMVSLLVIVVLCIKWIVFGAPEGGAPDEEPDIQDYCATIRRTLD